MVEGMVAFTALHLIHNNKGVEKVLPKIFLSGVLLTALILIIGSCQDDNPSGTNQNPSDTLHNDDPSDTTENPGQNPKVEAFGTFLVQLIPNNPETQTPAHTDVYGTVYDGPSPPEYVFVEKMTLGPCKLLKVETPQCIPDCGLGAKCIATDNCMPEPDKIDIGIVTLNGLKYNGINMPFTMEANRKLKYLMPQVQLDYPPVQENDTITLSATGSESIPPFTLKVRGIAPLVVLSDSLLLADGQPITVQWLPPPVSGVSTITVRINISYHGGTKGEIQCQCEDNGSVTIPGVMLDELKSYGIAGWPVVDITRKSSAVDENTGVQLVVETTVTRLLMIPGLQSCNGQGECPAGQECVNRMCQ